MGPCHSPGGLSESKLQHRHMRTLGLLPLTDGCSTHNKASRQATCMHTTLHMLQGRTCPLLCQHTSMPSMPCRSQLLHPLYNIWCVLHVGPLKGKVP
jgi:hypothetical protein